MKDWSGPIWVGVPPGVFPGQTSTSPWMTCTFVVGDVAPTTSTTRTVPRTAAIALVVRISRVSPGFMRWRATPTAILPEFSVTVDRLTSSVMVRLDSSRTVTSALPPRSTLTMDRSAVLMRSSTNTLSLNRRGMGWGRGSRATVACPDRVVMTPIPVVSAAAGVERAMTKIDAASAASRARYAFTTIANLPCQRIRSVRVGVPGWVRPNTSLSILPRGFGLDRSPSDLVSLNLTYRDR